MINDDKWRCSDTADPTTLPSAGLSSGQNYLSSSDVSGVDDKNLEKKPETNILISIQAK